MVCAGCPVRKQCGEYRERTNVTDGMWAGEIKKRGKK